MYGININAKIKKIIFFGLSTKYFTVRYDKSAVFGSNILLLESGRQYNMTNNKRTTRGA